MFWTRVPSVFVRPMPGLCIFSALGVYVCAEQTWDKFAFTYTVLMPCMWRGFSLLKPTVQFFSFGFIRFVDNAGLVSQVCVSFEHVQLCDCDRTIPLWRFGDSAVL